MTQELLKQALLVPSSTFDLFEVFSQEFQTLKISVLEFLQPPDPPGSHFEDATKKLQDSLVELLESNKHKDLAKDIRKRLTEFENKIDDMMNSCIEDNLALTAKFEDDISKLKESLFNSQEIAISLRLLNEQERISFTVEKDSLMQQIKVLESEVEAERVNTRQQIESLTEVVKEEKCTRNKMEQWFQRRLEAIEYYINDYKANIDDEKKYQALINKVKSIKAKKPWNKDKPDIFLDQKALNQNGDGNEARSFGTATPFSHYAYLLSSFDSEENTINQAFIESQDQSLSLNQNILLDTSDTEYVEKSKNDPIDNFAKQMQSKNLSLTEKEKLFCAVLEDNTGNQNLLHVKLEEILQVGKTEEKSEIEKGKEEPSLSLGSFKFDKQDVDKIGNGCRRFNKTIKLDNLKDTELEIEVSSIRMGTEQRASDILDSFKKSKSLNSRVLGLDQRIQSKDTLSRIENDKDKNSELDKPILDFSISDQQENPESHRLLRESFQNILSFDKGNESLPQIGNKGNQSKQLSDINLSLIQGKKENNDFSKLFEKLEESNNFLGEDDMKNFLDKAESDLDLSSSSRHKPTQKAHDIFNHELGLLIDSSQIGKHSESAFISERILEEKPADKSSYKHSKFNEKESEVLNVNKQHTNKSEKEEESHHELEEHQSDIQLLELKQNNAEMQNENMDINSKKYTHNKPKPPSAPRRSMDFRQSNPFFDENVHHGQETSFEDPKDAFKPVSPKLNFSMFNIIENNSFDAEIENQSKQEEGNSLGRLKLEYKNLRATRSQTPQYRSHLKLETKLQHLFKGEQYIKEIRESTEESPPPKRNEPTNYFRSLSLQNHNQFTYNNVQPHSSYAKPRHDLLDISSSSPTRDPHHNRNPSRPLPPTVLPIEASKNYPAPNKHTQLEFCRRVPIGPVQKAQSAKYVRSMFTGGEDGGSGGLLKKKSEFKPISPSKKKSLLPEGSKSATFATQIDGSLQFRAKKFASKKIQE